MDAVKFIKERNRMCKSFYAPEYGSCRDCPAKWEECSDIDSEDINPNKIVAIVEEWSAAHPARRVRACFWSYSQTRRYIQVQVRTSAP